MRSEGEIRALLKYYVEEQEGGVDAFSDPGSAPQEWICLYCRYIRLLKWVLGELETPNVGGGMMEYGMYSSANAPDYSLREQLYGDPPDYRLQAPEGGIG